MATNRINGKEYIGQTINNLNMRTNNHTSNALGKNKKRKKYFHTAIEKHGPENFDWEILHKCNNINNLNKLEVYYINLYNTLENGYNLEPGGKNAIPTEESKKRMSIAQQKCKRTGKDAHFYGKHHSEETKQKLSELNMDHEVSKETKQKIAKTLKGRYTGKNNPNYGKRLSEERKQWLSKINKGKKLSEKAYSEKAIEKRVITHEKAVIVEGKYFRSMKEAAGFLGITSSALHYRLKTEWIGYKIVDEITVKGEINAII